MTSETDSEVDCVRKGVGKNNPKDTMRRSNRKKVKPKWMDDYHAYAVTETKKAEKMI